jgi:NAD(P)-dependent dehydrogenase (short-subunit alcohol dehydrogenase family)
VASRRNRLGPAPALPDLTGKVVVVTGGNSGIGFWTAAHLGRAGAHVVLACRSVERAEAAKAELRELAPDAEFVLLALDLADLTSVRAAAEDFLSRYDRLDVLVNNAGVALAPFSRTADGFELHLGANFLGHFALTGLLVDVLVATPHSRVVQVGSLAQLTGRISFDDPNYERRRYFPWGAYAQSKVASVLFLRELDRRLGVVGSTTLSVGAHPGISFTGIADDMWIVRVPGIRAAAAKVEGPLLNFPEQAAQISVYAATAAAVTGGSYYGPDNRFEFTGPPAPARVSRRARSTGDARRLWDLAEALTGVRYLPDR